MADKIPGELKSALHPLLDTLAAIAEQLLGFVPRDRSALDEAGPVGGSESALAGLPVAIARRRKNQPDAQDASEPSTNPHPPRLPFEQHEP